MKPKFVTICLLQTFPLVGAVLMMPALSAILKDFSVSPNSVQLIVVIYLLGYALGELPYGWLALRIGRRRTTLISLVMFSFGALMCSCAPAFWVLLAARGLMAMGAGEGLMMGYTLVGDHYDLTEGRRMIGLTSILIGLAPGVSSLVGGFLTAFAGWHSCCYALIGYAGLVWLFARKMPETKPVSFASATQAYATLIRNPEFVCLCMMSALTSALMYVFETVAPLSSVHVLGVPEHFYGLLSMVPIVGGVGGCVASALLARRWPLEKALSLGLYSSLCGCVIQVTAFMWKGLSLQALFIPMPLIYFGLPLVYTNGIMKALTLGENKAVAAALFCVMNIVSSVLGVFFVSRMTSAINNLSFVFLTLVALMWVFYRVARFTSKSYRDMPT